jgi:ABC-type multidrug transport system permease subunit
LRWFFISIFFFFLVFFFFWGVRRAPERRRLFFLRAVSCSWFSLSLWSFCAPRVTAFADDSSSFLCSQSLKPKPLLFVVR